MLRGSRLIDLFLDKYRDADGKAYKLVERPDELQRNAPAVDAIAVNDIGNRLAIEHTRIEPLPGQLADDPPFIAVFDRLHHSPELTIPNLLVDISVPVGAVPVGPDWKMLEQAVYDWFKDLRLRLRAGDSQHSLPFGPVAHIQTMEIPDTPGALVVGRILPIGRDFSDVLRKALTDKLSKLVGADSNGRILLLEDASSILGLTRVPRELTAMGNEFSDLETINEIWLAHAPVWESEKVVWFFRVWPGGVTERFRLDDSG